MDFSIHLKLPLPEFPITTDWGPINATIAQSTERATWATAWATWAGVVVTFVAACAAIYSAVQAWKAVQAWRDQVMGEHEFSRLLGAIQALHDIDAAITNVRSQIRREGESDEKTRSFNFRQDIGAQYSRFLGQTVGLDIIWSTNSNYKELTEQLRKLITEVALAANYVFEKSEEAIPQYQALMGSPWNTTEGFEVGEKRVKDATERIQKVIGDMRLFLETKLRAYSKT
jgi:hypothetical protein